MSQLEMLRTKCKKWGGEVRNITTDYSSGTAIIHIKKGNQMYSFPFKDKNTTKAIEVLSWSIRNLIACDERKILPFEKTAHEFLQLTGSTEPFVEADEKWFKILGLDNKASNDEVKKKYTEFAKNFHPDTIVSDTFPGANDLRKDMEKTLQEKTEAYTEIKKARRF
jgi:hypothetical protein